MVFGLHQLHVVVVRAGNHRWSADKAGKAAIDGCAAFGACAVKNHVAVVFAALFAGLVELGNASIRWVVDERGTSARNSLAAALIPKLVIGDDARWIAGSADAVDDEVAVLALILEFFPFCRFFGR